MRYVGEPVTTVVDRTFAAATDAVSASSPVKMYANLFNPMSADATQNAVPSLDQLNSSPTGC
jgi:hypothetical protein